MDLIRDNCLDQCRKVFVASIDEVEAIKQNKHRVAAVARSFAAVSQREDLEQVGQIALLQAWRVWEARDAQQHTVPFWSFARRRVLGAMLDYLERESRFEVAKEDPAEQLDEAAASPASATELREHLSSLSDLQVQILAGQAAGETVREIADEVGLSRTTAHREMQKLALALESIRKGA